MMKPEVGDIWHAKNMFGSDYYFLLTKEMHNVKFLGRPYPVFESINLSSGEVSKTHFRDMSLWTRKA